jgi:predicted MFS family arabinose efflux permease
LLHLLISLGVFLVNSDSAILLALFREIASDFNALGSASWIVNSYVMGVIIVQPLVSLDFVETTSSN